VPHDGQATCGCFSSRHCGHALSVVAVVFQFARRDRVLERDIFRFGTATSVLFLCVGARAGGLATVFGCPALVEGEALQRRPPRVDDVVLVVRVVREACPAFGAQPRAVVPAHRLERQCGHHRVTQRGLEVEQVALELAQVVLVLLALGPLAGVGVQLLQVGVQRRARAPCR
jgi:hypothetical protein